jgi:regulator of sigma E protease
LQPGDKILSVAGRATPTFEDIRSVVMLRPNEKVRIEFQRGQSIRQVETTLKAKDDKDISGKPFHKGELGVAPTMELLQPISVFKAIPAAVDYTARITITIVDGLGKVLTGQVSSKAIGGPITIATAAGAGAALGPLAFISLVALLSINLGFINLLPVPMLDGGHLFFYVVEAVRRRPISAQALDWAFRGGLALILALLVFATFNDLGLWSQLERLIG